MATEYESPQEAQRTHHDDQDRGPSQDDRVNESTVLPPWLQDTPAPEATSTDLCQSAYCPEMTLTAPDELWLGATGRVDVQLRSRERPAEMFPTLGVTSSDPFVAGLEPRDDVLVESRKLDEHWALTARAPGRTTLESELDAPPDLLLRRQAEVTVPQAEVEWVVEKLSHSGTHPDDVHQLMRATSRDGVDTPADELVVRARISNFVDSDEVLVKHVLQGDILGMFEHEQLPSEVDEAAGTMVMGMRFRPRSEAVGALPMRLGVSLGDQAYHFEHDCSVVMTTTDFDTRINMAKVLADSAYRHYGLWIKAWGMAIEAAIADFQRGVSAEAEQQKQKIANDTRDFETKLTAALTVVTAGTAGLFAKASQAAGAGVFAVEGAKDLFKSVTRDQGKRLISSGAEALAPSAAASSGELSGDSLSGGGAAAPRLPPVDLSRPDQIADRLVSFAESEGKAVNDLIVELYELPSETRLNFDPVTIVSDVLVLDSVPLQELPIPPEEIRWQLEAGLWSAWLQENHTPATDAEQELGCIQEGPFFDKKLPAVSHLGPAWRRLVIVATRTGNDDLLSIAENVLPTCTFEG